MNANIPVSIYYLVALIICVVKPGLLGGPIGWLLAGGLRHGGNFFHGLANYVTYFPKTRNLLVRICATGVLVWLLMMGAGIDTWRWNVWAGLNAFEKRVPLTQEAGVACVFRGKVVAATHDGTTIPIGGVSVRSSQFCVMTDKEGLFELRLPAVPRPAELLMFDNPRFVRRFLRADNPLLSDSQAVVVLTGKPRIMIDVRSNGRGAQALESHLDEVLRACERAVTNFADVESLNKSDRAEVLEAIHSMTVQDRPLFDPSTVTKIGLFRGATHGMFISSKPAGENLVCLEGALVELGTAVEFARQKLGPVALNEAADASSQLADKLLSKLTWAEILDPLSDKWVDSVISARGYVNHRPKHGVLWLVVGPLGTSRQYPQERLIPNDDGTWSSNSVTLGDGKTGGKMTYSLQLVLATPGADRLFGDYLESRRNVGLDLASLENSGECRVYPGIQVESGGH